MTPLIIFRRAVGVGSVGKERGGGGRGMSEGGREEEEVGHSKMITETYLPSDILYTLDVL